MVNKKGQGLSLNVIIVAALALIVLVVLIMVFTGRIGIFTKGVEEGGNAELASLRVTYGDCHPGATDELTFRTEFGAAESVEAEVIAKSNFQRRISECKANRDTESCDAQGCSWK